MATMEMTFEQKLAQEIQNSVLKKVRDGNLLDVDWQNRVKIPADKIRQVYANVNWDHVLDSVKSQIEAMIAEKIIHSLATELATDVKQIMCNKELREDLRATLRQMIRDGMKNVS